MSSKSVLIVDDAVETRLFLKGLINSLGYSSIEAKSGLDALKILKDQKIDLVILDVLMPNLDGYQTLEFINQLKPTQDIKVVFLTGKRGELDQAKMDALKPDDLIHKTVDIQVLKTKLKKLIGTDENQAHAAPKSTPPPPIAAAPSPPKPAPAQTPAAAPAKPTPASGTEAKLDINATITNMPIVLEIKITKLTQTGIVFSSKFQFKEGALLSINCPQASTSLKKTGELQTKVQKCIQEADIFIVNTIFT